MKLKFKKYMIKQLPEEHPHPDLANDLSKQRMREEFAMYKKLQGDDRMEISEDDGGMTYYIINARWIDAWREWI